MSQWSMCECGDPKGDHSQMRPRRCLANGCRCRAFKLDEASSEPVLV